MPVTRLDCCSSFEGYDSRRKHEEQQKRVCGSLDEEVGRRAGVQIQSSAQKYEAFGGRGMGR